MLARNPARLAKSLAEFTGHPAYGLVQLRDDLERFILLLGGSDGELLFAPNPGTPSAQPGLRRALRVSTSLVFALLRATR